MIDSDMRAACPDGEPYGKIKVNFPDGVEHRLYLADPVDRDLEQLRATVARLERENNSLRRRLGFESAGCVHAFGTVSYRVEETETGVQLYLEEECCKCLKRRPCQ